MSLAWLTFAPELLFTLLRGDAQMLTPSPTVLSVPVTMFTPLAELSELPAREALAESFVVIVDPAVAIELLSV